MVPEMTVRFWTKSSASYPRYFWKLRAITNLESLPATFPPPEIDRTKSGFVRARWYPSVPSPHNHSLAGTNPENIEWCSYPMHFLMVL
jgi:hypothetical protein